MMKRVPVSPGRYSWNLSWDQRQDSKSGCCKGSRRCDWTDEGSGVVLLTHTGVETDFCTDHFQSFHKDFSPMNWETVYSHTGT